MDIELIDEIITVTFIHKHAVILTTETAADDIAETVAIRMCKKMRDLGLAPDYELGVMRVGRSPIMLQDTVMLFVGQKTPLRFRLSSDDTISVGPGMIVILVAPEGTTKDVCIDTATEQMVDYISINMEDSFTVEG